MSITTPRSLLGAAIAATLLLSSPALAKPMPLDPPAAAPASRAVSPNQDLRGEMARSSAQAITQAPAPKQDLRGEHARDASRPAVAPVPAAPRVVPVSKSLPAVSDNGSRPDTWLLIALGLAGIGVIAAGTSGLVRARRVA